VTGHRKISDPEGVTAAVEKLFERVDRLFNKRDRTPVEWVVVSSLARGADRIVAQAVLARQDARLEVVTPFPLEEYRKDFIEQADLAGFEGLRKQAATVIELDDNASEPGQRHKGYLCAGKAVVDSCEILVAVWDGKPAAGEGGTADIVEYALQHDRIVLWINAENPSRPAHRLVSETDKSGWFRGIFRRKGNTGKGSPPQDSRFSLARIPGTARKLSIGYCQLDAFNRDASIRPARVMAAVQETGQKLRQCATEAGLSEARIDSIINNVLPCYAHADQLAIHYQQRHTVASKAIFLLSALAVTIAVFQMLFFTHMTWLVSFEILAMLALLLSLGVNRWNNWHEKWLHDRHLAEQLRTVMFSLVLGEDAGARLAETRQILSFYAGPQNWLMAVVRQIVRKARQPEITSDELEPAKRFIKQCWLQDQQHFHKQSAVYKEKSSHRVHGTVVMLFVVTLIMAMLHLFDVGHGHEGMPLFSPARWITFLAIVLPAWGAAIHGIGKQLQYERIAARSGQMAELLARIIERVEDADTEERLREIVHEATRVMGLENYEWWVLLSFDKAVPVV